MMNESSIHACLANVFSPDSNLDALGSPSERLASLIQYCVLRKRGIRHRKIMGLSRIVGWNGPLKTTRLV